ncbi:MAG: DNA recombination protein RmuC [Bdellovibrionales bacterium]
METWIMGLGWLLFLFSVLSIFLIVRRNSNMKIEYRSLLKDIDKDQERLQKLALKLESNEDEIRSLLSDKAQLAAGIEEKEKSFSRERESLAKNHEELKAQFRSLASEVLDQSNREFLQLATERLDKKSMEHQHKLDEKSQSFEGLVKPIKEVINKLEGDIKSVEKERSEQFVMISEQLKAVSSASDSLRKETNSLSSALRKPEVRGSWGELQLRRVVELAGMSAYCDFEEQVSVKKDDALQKPDLIVHLPNQRVIVIDSKAVLDAFLDAIEADDPITKKQALERHAKNLRARVKELSRKSYWDQFENAPDFVVLFVPNEALLYAAVEVDRDLLEDAFLDKIIVATPTTLVTLLKTVAYGWQQEQVAANAQKVIKAAKELYERVSIWMRKLNDHGVKLNSAVKSYNESVGSLQNRVVPSARRLQELGLSEMDELVEPESLDQVARELKVEESSNTPKNRKKASKKSIPQVDDADLLEPISEPQEKENADSELEANK